MKRQLPLDMAGVRSRQLETRQVQQTKRARQEEGGAGEQPGTGLAVQRISHQDLRDSNASTIVKVVRATTMMKHELFSCPSMLMLDPAALVRRSS